MTVFIFSDFVIHVAYLFIYCCIDCIVYYDPYRNNNGKSSGAYSSLLKGCDVESDSNVSNDCDVNEVTEYNECIRSSNFKLT